MRSSAQHWEIGAAIKARDSVQSPERAARLQPGVSAALPPVIQARDSVYRASSARPAILRGLLAVLRRSRVPIFSSISILSIWGFSLNLSFLVYLAYAECPPFLTFLR